MFRTQVDDDERVSDAVVRLVAAVETCDPLELAPLGNSVDPDAIDAVFAAPEGTDRKRTVAFTYLGYTVTVEGTAVEQSCTVVPRQPEGSKQQS